MSSWSSSHHFFFGSGRLGRLALNTNLLSFLLFNFPWLRCQLGLVACLMVAWSSLRFLLDSEWELHGSTFYFTFLLFRHKRSCLFTVPVLSLCCFSGLSSLGALGLALVWLCFPRQTLLIKTFPSPSLPPSPMLSSLVASLPGLIRILSPFSFPPPPLSPLTPFVRLP